jgi:hypothetical protein
VTGSVSIANTSLSVTIGAPFVPTIGEVFTIIGNDEDDEIVGTFLNLPEGSTVTTPDLNYFTLSYAGGYHGNDVTLTALTGKQPSVTVASPASADYGTLPQQVVLGATVTSGGMPLNEGTVTFSVLAGSTPVGSPVTSGSVAQGAASAMYALPASTPLGTYTIVATFNATSTYGMSTDSSQLLTVLPTATNIVVDPVSVIGSAVDREVILSATVTSPTGPVSAGSVTFAVLDDIGTICGAHPSPTNDYGEASATCILPGGTAAGNYFIRAGYHPSGGGFGGSQASGRLLSVMPPPVSAIAANSTWICGGGSVLLSATATGGSGEYLTYQWSRDGSILDDVSSDSCEVDLPGLYTVTVTDSSGAVSEDSEALEVTAAAPADPAAWWRAEGDANDAMGSAHGTPTNGASFVDVQAGQAFLLDGVDDWIDLGGSSLVGSAYDPFSVALWIYPTRAPYNASSYALIRLQQDSQFVLAVARDEMVPGEYITAFFQGAAQWGFPVSLGDLVEDWTHVVVVYDGGDPSDPASFALYFDGVQLAEDSVYMGAAGGALNDNAIGAGESADSHFPGALDEVQVYTRALSAAEAWGLWESGGLSGRAIVGPPQAIPFGGTTATLGGNDPGSGGGLWSVVSGGDGSFVPDASTPGAAFAHAGGGGPILLRWTVSNPPCTSSSADVAITILPSGTVWTPTGGDVIVEPIDPDTGTSPVSITFTEVLEGGATTVATLGPGDPPGPPPQTGFKLANTYISIHTDASYVPPIRLCFDYSGYVHNANQESSLEVIHIVPENGLMNDGSLCTRVNGCDDNITDPDLPPDYPNPDTVSDIICGTSNSLSLFAVVEAIELTAPLDPVAVNTDIVVSLELGDSSTIDGALWSWGDGSQSPATLTGGFLEGSHAYQSAGIYTPSLTLWMGDQEAGSADFKYIVVYDPNGGFVTGGGWINSPPGAYPADPVLTGKANFGFVAKYVKGAQVPTGTT